VVKNTFLVTTTKISLIHILSPFEQAEANSSGSLCTLRWKFGKLFVSRDMHQKINLGPLENLQWLTSCLNHSSTEAVYIDLDLGNNALQLWAEACQKAKKPVFVRIPSDPRLPHKLHPLKWASKRLIDRSIAALLIISLNPIILTLILLIRLTSPGPIFSQRWSIGLRGKLFKVIKFRIIANDSTDNLCQILQLQQSSQDLLGKPQLTRLGYWMQRYCLDSLPQLINVLRGEMSLFGSSSLDIYEATQIDSRDRRYLHTLPGMINAFHSNKSF
jgi:lipopolysaccharide/colanic/teichoic acid biosynthesis glycosyltransferase